jgi:hypothetical protein
LIIGPREVTQNWQIASKIPETETPSPWHSWSKCLKQPFRSFYPKVQHKYSQKCYHKILICKYLTLANQNSKCTKIALDRVPTLFQIWNSRVFPGLFSVFKNLHVTQVSVLNEPPFLILKIEHVHYWYQQKVCGNLKDKFDYMNAPLQYTYYWRIKPGSDQTNKDIYMRSYVVPLCYNEL